MASEVWDQAWLEWVAKMKPYSRRLDEIIEQVRHIAFDIERDDTHKVDAIRRLLAPESDARPGSGGGPLTWSDVFDCYGHDIADLI